MIKEEVYEAIERAAEATRTDVFVSPEIMNILITNRALVSVLGASFCPVFGAPDYLWEDSENELWFPLFKPHADGEAITWELAGTMNLTGTYHNTCSFIAKEHRHE